MGMCLGVDIGYGNLKVVVGDRDGAVFKTIIRPAWVGHMSSLNGRLGKEVELEEVVPVLVDGEPYAAATGYKNLHDPQRELHADYPRTVNYRALYHAALSLSGTTEIEQIVTGLPTSQAFNHDLAATLEKQMTGTFQVAPSKSVTVKAVAVMPQPGGAIMDLFGAATPEDLEIYKNSRILVIDPGFYSLDWISVDDGRIIRKSSHSSKRAMSTLVEDINQQIYVDRGGSAPGPLSIEAAMRSDKEHLYVGGEKIELKPLIQTAINDIAKKAMAEVKQSIRSDERSIDFVLLAGGGAAAWEQPVRDTFPKVKLLVPDQTVLANARGFYRGAVQHARNAAVSSKRGKAVA